MCHFLLSVLDVFDDQLDVWHFQIQRNPTVLTLQALVFHIISFHLSQDSSAFIVNFFPLVFLSELLGHSFVDAHKNRI